MGAQAAKLDGIRVIEECSRPGSAEIDIETAPGAGTIYKTKTLEGSMNAANEIAAIQDGLQSFAADGWQASIAVLPSSLGSASLPAALAESQKSLPERRESAKALIRSLGGGDTPIRIRVALPVTAGARILFARLRADWSHINVEAIRVTPGQPADLILIDRVAAFSHAMWYLEALGCTPSLMCNEAYQSSLRALRSISDEAERAANIAKADAYMASAQMFIPLATPLRWSLVDDTLPKWKANRYAAHPIQHLRD